MGDQVEDSVRRTLKRLLPWVRSAVAVGLLIVLFRVVPLHRIAAQLRRADLRLLGAVLLVAFAGMLLCSLKLWLLVRTAHPEASLLSLLRAYYVGAFFNNFLPTSVGGDVMKINEMHRAGIPLRHATASVVVERGTGLAVVLAAAAAISIGWGGLFDRLKLQTLRWPLAAFGVGGLLLPVVLYLLWRARLKSALQAHRQHKVLGALYRVVESFYVFRNSPGTLALALVMSAVFYGLIAVNLILMARAMGGVVRPLEAVGIIPMRAVSDMIPVSIGGLGVREGVLTYCLTGLGLEPARAGATALMLRLAVWVHSALGGCLYAVGRRPGNLPKTGGGRA